MKLLNDDDTRQAFPAKWLKNSIRGYNLIGSLYEDLSSYTYGVFSTDTRNKEAAGEISVLEEIGLPISEAEVLFRNKLADIRDIVQKLIKTDPDLMECTFFLNEQLFLQDKQMAPELEKLAADLSRAGGDAWSRMHEAVTSTAKIIWNGETGEIKTVTQLRTLAHDKDRSIREKAFRKELKIWEDNKIPLSFALNGIKGFSISLNKRRNYSSSLERSLYQARISEKTIDSLIGAMENSLPMFRKYLKAKAKVLNLPKMAFFDLFAPIGKSVKVWNYNESSEFIIEKFNGFSPELGDFAANAFRNN